MKKLFITIIILMLCIGGNIYSQVKYTNPILAGSYPNPSIWQGWCEINEEGLKKYATPNVPFFA